MKAGDETKNECVAEKVRKRILMALALAIAFVPTSVIAGIMKLDMQVYNVVFVVVIVTYGLLVLSIIRLKRNKKD